MIILPNLSLYIHIPWCYKKCPYCDFNSYVSKNTIPEKKYIKHLIQDLKKDIILVKNRKISSIFIGGGTPNLIHINNIKYLIKKIKNIIKTDKLKEITIEINPENITINELLIYKKIGINRISLGIQTFNNKLLKLIGRSHTKKKAINILEEIKKKNIFNINIDLMYGLPEQTVKESIYDLEKAIFFNPQHISWYQLSVEKNTLFYSKKINLPNDKIIWNMYKSGNKILKKLNYKNYEISAYSKLNHQCLHNLNYWKFGDYIGIGAGAHGKITQKNGNIIRTIKHKNIYHYMNNKEYNEKIYKIENKDKALEYFMNVFRLTKPVKKKNFTLYTGLQEKHIQKIIKNCIKKKYIIETKKRWHVLPLGRRFLNNLLELFIQ